MTTIDLLASEPHFADHLAPIWQQLPQRVRGAFVIPAHQAATAARLGIRRGHPISDAVLVASWGDHKRARKFGYERIARIEHGIGQSFSDDHPAYAGGIGCDDVELFLVPNQVAGRRWQAAYPRAQVAVVGCPKNDRPPIHFRSSPPIVVVSFHWGGNASQPETTSAWDDFAGAVLALRDDARFRLAIHGHPKAAPRIEPWARRHRLEFIPTFDQVLQVAAAYVCDGVSTLYEFAATDRPVVVLNAAAYRRDVEHGLRFWREASVGIQVDVGADLGAAIALALEDRPEQRRLRRASVRRVYAHRGDASRRAAASLTGWLEQRSEVAA
ncbi:MAG: hypothetical protein IT341_10590 [Chloroflexi bacterium]|nr:hypothetical protein [Chloroflexota bacterium]